MKKSCLLPLLALVVVAVLCWLYPGGSDDCPQYNSALYDYSQSLKDRIIAEYGGVVYSPYTNERFADKGDVEIEHIVARFEAHRSGLCIADDEAKRRFANDPLNLTLASPATNDEKAAKNAAKWLPKFNQCWFAGRVLATKHKYDLTIDRQEAAALSSALAECDSVEMSPDARWR